MVKLFFFVVINCFSIHKNSSITDCLDRDLFRLFIFYFTMLLLNAAKQKQKMKLVF